MQPMFYLYEVVQQIILYSIIEIHVVWYMFQYGRRFPKSCGPLLLDSWSIVEINSKLLGTFSMGV